jgi:hypothetical protein
MSLSPAEGTMNLHRHENLKSFISPGQISLLQPYEQNLLISHRTHLLAGIALCGYKFCFQIKLIELGVVMGISRLLSSQQNFASITGDQEDMGQHLGRSGLLDPNPGRCKVYTLHNSAHYSELSSVAFLN